MRMGSAEFELVAVDAAGIPISTEERLDSEITDTLPTSTYTSSDHERAHAQGRGSRVASA